MLILIANFDGREERYAYAGNRDVNLQVIEDRKKEVLAAHSDATFQTEETAEQGDPQ